MWTHCFLRIRGAILLIEQSEMRQSCVKLLFLMVIVWTTVPSLEAQNGTVSDQLVLNFGIQAFPVTILEGETEESEVRCDYLGPFHLASISILKKDPTSGDPVQLAYVSLNQPKHVMGQNGIQAKQTSGEIKNEDGSGYLSIKWPFPSQHQKGLYKCQVVALAGAGVVKSEKSVRVRASEVTVAGLLRIVGSLKEELRSVKGEVGSVKGEVGSVKEELGSVKGDGEAVKGKVESLTGGLGSLKGEVDTLKAVSPWTAQYRGHTYRLFLNLPITETKAQSICQRMGGYLAEIDNREEHRFVLGFITPRTPKNFLILIAGSDEKQEDRWVYQRTNRPVPFFDWYPGQPGQGRSENCLCLLDKNKGRNFQFHDLSCNMPVHRPHHELGFLCEVPTSKS